MLLTSPTSILVLRQRLLKLVLAVQSLVESCQYVVFFGHHVREDEVSDVLTVHRRGQHLIDLLQLVNLLASGEQVEIEQAPEVMNVVANTEVNLGFDARIYRHCE